MIFFNKFNQNIIKKKLFNIDLLKLRSHSFFKEMTKRNDIMYEKYNKYLTNSKIVTCLVCDKKNSEIFYKSKKYKLINCRKCFAVSANINHNKYNTKLYHEDNYKKKFIRKNIEKNFQYRSDTFGKERIEYIEEYTSIRKNKKIKILDYGCGFGSFLYALKKHRMNYLAKGLDFDLDSINFCKSKGLYVDNKNLEYENDNNYDLITLFDVIEHVNEPKKLISNLINKLKVGGYIFFMTPNLNSISTMLMKDKHNMFSPFDHLCFYNLETFKFIAKRFDLKLIHYDYYGLDVKDYLQYIESTMKKKIKLNLILNDFSIVMQNFIDSADYSNAFRIILQKK